MGYIHVDPLFERFHVMYPCWLIDHLRVTTNEDHIAIIILDDRNHSCDLESSGLGSDTEFEFDLTVLRANWR